VALFLQRAQALKPEFQMTSANAKAIAEICVRLDGLPLAIELAATRIKLFPPQALLTRLSHRLTVLTSGARDAPARQQTLRNTIEWSYNLLDVSEQRLFRQLSVFVRGCTLQAVEAVCAALGDEAGSVLNGVASLIDKSLLQQIEQEEEPRFMMLETIREYGQESLEGSGEMEMTQQAHASYYLALAEKAAPELQGPQQTDWYGRLEREHDNLRAALRWSIEWEEAGHTNETAWRLIEALNWFWLMRGYLNEGRQWLERMLTGSETVVSSRRAWALYNAGRLAVYQDDFGWAESLTQQALTFFQEQGDKRGIALCLRRLGDVAGIRHNYQAARTQLEESVAILRALDNRPSLAYSLGHLAPILSKQGEYASAYLLAEEGLELGRKTNNKELLAHVLHNFAKVLFSQGEYAQAYIIGEKSLALNRELGLKWLVAWSLELLGQIVLHQRDRATACSLFEEGLAVYRE
jgi:tetratricopeptide (TPR) repeat protein